MKRTLFAVLSASLLLLGAPGAASAHHGKRHTACRAGMHPRHAKCARARVLRFGPILATPGAGTGTATPAPTTPAGNETAGTITSYLAPTLTITLNDKKTEVSGKVTENTRLECESAAPTSGGEEGDDDGSGDGSQLAGTHSDTAIAADQQGDQGRGEDEGDQSQAGDESGGEDGNVQPCTTSALTPGTTVRAAELELGGEGAVWEKVILVT